MILGGKGGIGCTAAKRLCAENYQVYATFFNMISPGMVETPLLENLPPKLVEITAHQNPLKRNATPEDIANAVYFFASEQTSYINGSNLLKGGNVLA